MAGKTDFKQLLLDKGEKIAVGLAGLGMLLFGIMGVMALGESGNPEAKASEITQSTQSLRSGMTRPGDEPKPIEQPKFETVLIDGEKFTLYTDYTNPLMQPQTKRTNPLVLSPKEFQVDLVHAKIRSYDLIAPDLVGLVVPSKVDPNAKADLTKWKKAYGARIKRAGGSRPTQQAPSGFGKGPPAGGPSGEFGGGPMGVKGGMPMGGMPMGGTGFDPNAKRAEVIYVKNDDNFEKNVPAGGRLAETILPERVVVVNASFPYKDQLEEFRKKLNLKSLNDVLSNPDFEPVFRGFNVERRVLNAATGVEVQPFTRLDYEDNYLRTIYKRKIGDHPESADLGYVMLSPQYRLVMPLPLLVDSSYPPVKLTGLNDEIEKINKSMRIPATPTAMSKKFKGQGDIWEGLDVSSEFSAGIGGPAGMEGFGPMGPMGGGRPAGIIPGGSNSSPYGVPMGSGGVIPPGKLDRSNKGQPPPAYEAMPPSQDPLGVCMIRFMDVDIQPGFIYQYRIQLKMLNPNFGKRDDVQRKSDADIEELVGEWTLVSQVVADETNPAKRKEVALEAKVPKENFLFAIDMPADRKATPGPGQIKEGEAMVQIHQWREQIKIDSRVTEPVGDWIVAEFPVMRGEYVGQKQFVKLPLWSSGLNAYTLRDVATALAKPKKTDPKDPPKGVLMDFTRTDRVVVEVEGGKLAKTFVEVGKKKTIADESDTEIMILEEDSGKLRVLSTSADQENQTRQAREKKWKEWVAYVEANSAAGATDGKNNNPFARPEDGK